MGLELSEPEPEWWGVGWGWSLHSQSTRKLGMPSQGRRGQAAREEALEVNRDGASDWAEAGAMDWLLGKGEQRRGRATPGGWWGPPLPWGKVVRKRLWGGGGETIRDLGFGLVKSLML